ncbi:Protein DOWN-REGULATED IN DIF1 [Dirofilaria immitis]
MLQILENAQTITMEEAKTKPCGIASVAVKSAVVRRLIRVGKECHEAMGVIIYVGAVERLQSSDIPEHKRLPLFSSFSS